MLEYFEGMLFLTSNRAEDFDEAFLSRIHLKITLPELGPPQRAEIWKGLVNHRRNATNASAWQPKMFESLGKLNVNVRPSTLVHSLEALKRELTVVSVSIGPGDQEPLEHGHARSRGKPLAIEHICDVIQVELSSKARNSVAHQVAGAEGSGGGGWPERFYLGCP